MVDGARNDEKWCPNLLEVKIRRILDEHVPLFPGSGPNAPDTMLPSVVLGFGPNSPAATSAGTVFDGQTPQTMGRIKNACACSGFKS